MVVDPDGEIVADDPRRADVSALLEKHLTFARSHTPPEDVHALGVDGLVDPAVTFYGFRRHGQLLGVGALKELGHGHAEIKSMHTAESARGHGVGRAMVDHLIAEARRRGLRRISLETGTMVAFAPARTLYRSVGFTPCPAFADYFDSPNSVCMTLEL